MMPPLWPSTLFNFTIHRTSFVSSYFVAAGFWLKRSRVHIFCSPTRISVDSENDGHVTDPTSPWCLVLGLVRFQLVESWMSFRGPGLVQEIQAKLLKSFVSAM